MPLILTAVFLLMLGLSACVSEPYGYTRQQWRELSTEEQAKAQAEYKDIIKLKDGQQHEDLIEMRKQSVIDYGSGMENKF